MDTQYQVWVINLSIRADGLKSKALYAKVDEIDRECITCNAEIKQLTNYAVQHNLDLMAFIPTLMSSGMNFRIGL